MFTGILKKRIVSVAKIRKNKLLGFNVQMKVNAEVQVGTILNVVDWEM